jgi:hypothetical protein
VKSQFWLQLSVGIVLAWTTDSLQGADGIVESPAENSNQRPRTFFVTRSLGHELLMPYLEEARPEIVQIGNYGAMFHGYADDPRSMKTPMMLPVSGERAALAFQRKLNERVHGLGLKVVGHFRLTKVMADWQEQTGFVDYYNTRWPDDLLGPKPHQNLIELLQRDADGVPIQLSRYENAQLALCLSSPYARQVLKQMLKCAVDHGVDGVITTYNYRQSCACPHCQTAFRKWLAEKLTPRELQSRLGIGKLDEHIFRSIPVQIPGYPDPATATELDWLAMEWGASHFKQMYDEVFLDYGRSLRKDLLVAQWNHLSHVSLKEERMFLPKKEWGQGEDYFWYSGGASFVGKNLSLKDGKAGDAWLSSLYARELSGGRPVVMGKYDGIRLAASMAEGYAMDGLGMGRYMRFEDPTGYKVLARYTNFMHTHREFYDGAQQYSDVALVLPRQSVWDRHPAALDDFRELGQALVERQVLLDVLADESVSLKRLSDYPAIVLPDATALTARQLTSLQEYAATGGTVFVRGRIAAFGESGEVRPDLKLDAAIPVAGEVTVAAEAIQSAIVKHGSSRIQAPWTIRATAYSQPSRTVLHLVNYARNETPYRKLKGPELERPVPAENIVVELRLPVATTVTAVTIHRPDQEKPLELPFQQREGRLTVNVPRVLVYAVISVEHQAG